MMRINRCGHELGTNRMPMGEDAEQRFSDLWPGYLWLEGKTPLHLREDQERPVHMPRGPAKRTGPGFVNPAMAPARTRSVLMLSDALSHEWLVDSEHPIRAMDALCSTGIRFRRWRTEIEQHHQQRLRIHANDMDQFALLWAQSTMKEHPPQSSWTYDETLFNDHQRVHGTNIDGIFYMSEDARIALHRGAYQWIDLDPFGSPITFLDAAIQGLGRKGVLEVTATDTAALTGSSPSPQRRRYGSSGIVDAYAHDDAIRTLIGVVATTAAKHDRYVRPILALFDGHHVRVSVLVIRSKEGASDTHSSIGWRVRKDNGGYVFVHHPQPEELPQSSGPLWIGALWNHEITKRMTEERALELCYPNEDERELLITNGLEWDDKDWEYARREICRSVRHIHDASTLLSTSHSLVHVDAFAKHIGLSQIPRMEHIFSEFNTNGFRIARVPDVDPMFATDASFEECSHILRSMDVSHK